MRYVWRECEWLERPRRKDVLHPIPVVEPSKEYLNLIKILRSVDEAVNRLMAGLP
jgi:hypothetical protein